MKKLYANHAPQLKPRKPEAAAGSAAAAAAEALSQQDEIESVDPVEDMYNILEGSALIPFLEVGAASQQSSIQIDPVYSC